jgi:hypothetical protein
MFAILVHLMSLWREVNFIFNLTRFSGFAPRSVRVRSVVERIGMGQLFLRILRISPVNIISPGLHTHVSRVFLLFSVNIIPPFLHIHSSEEWTKGPLEALFHTDSLTPSQQQQHSAGVQIVRVLWNNKFSIMFPTAYRSSLFWATSNQSIYSQSV